MPETVTTTVKRLTATASTLPTVLGFSPVPGDLVRAVGRAKPAVTRRPEVLDDFIRNVLLKMGMVRARGPRRRELGARRAGRGCLTLARPRARVRRRRSTCSSASGTG